MKTPALSEEKASADQTQAIYLTFKSGAMDRQQRTVLAGTASNTALFEAEIIADIPKNSCEIYRVSLRAFKGYRLVDIRVWFDDTESGQGLGTRMS